VEVYLRDQATILADVRARLRDGNSERWTDAEIYRCVNDALLTWHGRVSVPHVIDVAGGWQAGVYEYALPNYCNAVSVQPQMKVNSGYDYLNTYIGNADTWVDVPGWTIEPTADNGRKLRFDISPYSSEGRILWYGVNGPVPITVPTTNGSMPSGTTVELANVVECFDYGWFKIGNEWFQYNGVARGSGVTSLINVTRSLPNGVTYDLAYSPSTSVYFGVAMPKLDLYRVLLDQTFVYMNEMYLSNAAPKETQHHQEMIGFYEARIKSFWRAWMPVRGPRIIIDRSLSVL
jgi:hypothetical protein